MADAIQATINSAELLERVAQLIAHRACGGNEHDGMGKLHGNCVVCLVPWPCEYAGTPPAKDAELAEAKAALSAKEREAKELREWGRIFRQIIAEAKEILDGHDIIKNGSRYKLSLSSFDNALALPEPGEGGTR